MSFQDRLHLFDLRLLRLDDPSAELLDLRVRNRRLFTHQDGAPER